MKSIHSGQITTAFRVRELCVPPNYAANSTIPGVEFDLSLLCSHSLSKGMVYVVTVAAVIDTLRRVRKVESQWLRSNSVATQDSGELIQLLSWVAVRPLNADFAAFV